MGMLNVTPDSFSDGGRYLDPDRAVAHALEMEAAGADIIDIGGESTRPVGAREVPVDEELHACMPVLAAAQWNAARSDFHRHASCRGRARGPR